MQVDGEPWQQAAAVLEVGYRGAALMLRRLDSAPLARMAAAVSEALDACQVPPAAAAAAPRSPPTGCSISRPCLTLNPNPYAMLRSQSDVGHGMRWTRLDK